MAIKKRPMMVSFVFIAATQYTIGMEKTVSSAKYNVAWLPLKEYATNTNVQFKTYEGSKTYYIGAGSLSSPTTEITQNVDAALEYFRTLVNSNTVEGTAYSDYAAAYNFTPGSYQDVENICYIDTAGNRKYWSIYPELSSTELNDHINFYFESPEQIYIGDPTVSLLLNHTGILWLYRESIGTDIYVNDEKADISKNYDYIKIAARGWTSTATVTDDVVIDIDNYLDYKLSSIPKSNWLTEGTFFYVMSNYSAFRNTHIGIVAKRIWGRSTLLVWCFYRFSITGRINITVQLPSGSSSNAAKEVETSDDFAFFSLSFPEEPTNINHLTIQFDTTSGGEIYRYNNSDFKQCTYAGNTYFYSKGPIGVFRNEYKQSGIGGGPLRRTATTYYHVPRWVNHFIILDASTKEIINTKNINGSGGSDIVDLPPSEFYKVSFVDNDFPVRSCYIVCTAASNNDFTTNDTDIPDNAVYCYSWSTRQ